MSFRSRSSDHVPVVPTMMSTNPGVKRIQVFRNGDAYFQGVQVVINTHRVTDINNLLDVITERIGLTNGAKKLFTTSGTLVKDISKIKDNDKYVASSSHFTPMAYGGQSVEKKPGRSKTRSTERQQKSKIHPEKELKKKKKKKKQMKKKEKSPDPRPPSSIVSGTVEVETPSEVEDSEHEEHPETPEPPEPQESKKEPEKEPVKPRRKSIRPPHTSTNWGDLSTFTKNIETLLQK